MNPASGSKPTTVKYAEPETAPAAAGASPQAAPISPSTLPSAPGAGSPAVSPAGANSSQPGQFDAVLTALERLIDYQKSEGTESSARVHRFLQTRSIREALQAWFGIPDPERMSKGDIARLLNRAVGEIDLIISQQVNRIIHHPRFQKLEATWRGIDYLVRQADNEDHGQIQVRILNCSWKELSRDLLNAMEFDQSETFRKVYSEEFGTPGGEPFGMLLGDYEIGPGLNVDTGINDLDVLTQMRGVAAAAFCPFISQAAPSMFGVNQLTDLEFTRDLAAGFESLDFLKWREFRDSEDSRFVSLMVPHALMRLPYEDQPQREDGFQFREELGEDGRKAYLWGSAIYAFGEVVIRSYSDTNWPANVCGVERGIEGNGLVTGLPVQSFGTDAMGVALKSSTDLIISDELERELANLGFMSLCSCPGTEYSAFYSTPSLQKAKTYDRSEASMNARLSTMVRHMLCVSRFAHFLKVIARDKIGSFTEAEQLQRLLQSWLNGYAVSDDEPDRDTRAKYPLREAMVEVKPQLDNPGAYSCTIWLRPHFELDEMAALIRLKTQLAPPGRGV